MYERKAFRHLLEPAARRALGKHHIDEKDWQVTERRCECAAEIAPTLPESELGMRTSDRDHTLRVPRLAARCVRGAPAINPEIVGETLQQWETA